MNAARWLICYKIWHYNFTANASVLNMYFHIRERFRIFLLILSGIYYSRKTNSCSRRSFKILRPKYYLTIIKNTPRKLLANMRNLRDGIRQYLLKVKSTKAYLKTIFPGFSPVRFTYACNRLPTLDNKLRKIQFEHDERSKLKTVFFNIRSSLHQ